MSCSGGSKSAPRFGSGVGGVPALTTGERCVLAASWVMSGDDSDDDDDDGKVRNMFSRAFTSFTSNTLCFAV